MIGASLLLLTAAPATAPQVVVHGSGKVETAPTLANLSYSVRGEASTSDEAVRTLEANRKAIADAVLALAPADFEDGKLSIEAVRGDECKSGDYDRAVLSSGICAIKGYLAHMDVSLRTTAVKDAATLVGVIGRLKGSEPMVSSFNVADVQTARRAAIAVAVKDAKASAEALALASGARLGRVKPSTTPQATINPMTLS